MTRRLVPAAAVLAALLAVTDGRYARAMVLAGVAAGTAAAARRRRRKARNA
jgi:hypothetical protein